MDTSGWRSSCGKLNFLPISSIFLVFSSLEMQRRLIQTKVYYKLFYCLKRNVSQTFKSSSCKEVFLRCVHHSYNLLLRMFFISYNNWKTLIFIKNFRYPEVWYNRHVAASFETSVLKEVRILYPLSPQWHYNAVNTKGLK